MDGIDEVDGKGRERVEREGKRGAEEGEKRKREVREGEKRKREVREGEKRKREVREGEKGKRGVCKGGKGWRGREGDVKEGLEKKDMGANGLGAKQEDDESKRAVGQKEGVKIHNI